MKKIRRKKCVVCGESFKPQYTSLQKCCSTGCAITYAKLKEAQKTQSLNNMRNEKEDKDSLSKLIKSTEVIFNAYIRDRDKGKPCISCGRQWDSSFQAGHCFDKKQFHGIRFDLFNVWGQCQKCNLFEEGNYNSYRLRLANIIGDTEYRKLEKRAEIARKTPHKYTKFELREIQLKIKQLKDENKERD